MLMETEYGIGKVGGSAGLMLAMGRVWAGRIQRKGSLTITCLSGCLWVTREGDVSDYFLRPGEVFRSTIVGTLVVVEALKAGRVKIVVEGPVEVSWLRKLSDFMTGAWGIYFGGSDSDFSTRSTCESMTKRADLNICSPGSGSGVPRGLTSWDSSTAGESR
jgi:hypothetical protein